MAKIFDLQGNVTEHPNRNNFDLRHRSYGTYSLGTEYPVLCLPVVPGDKFDLSISSILNFFPTNFPTPSKMRVVFNAFYQRNKNGWENFENFAMGLEEHTHPYIAQPPEFYKTGSLADYLGIPSTIVTNGLTLVSYPFDRLGFSRMNHSYESGLGLTTSNPQQGGVFQPSEAQSFSSTGISGAFSRNRGLSLYYYSNGFSSYSQCVSSSFNFDSNVSTYLFAFCSHPLYELPVLTAGTFNLSLPVHNDGQFVPRLLIWLGTKSTPRASLTSYCMIPFSNITNDSTNSRIRGTVDFADAIHPTGSSFATALDELQTYLSSDENNVCYFSFIYMDIKSSSAFSQYYALADGVCLQFDLRDVHDISIFPQMCPYAQNDSDLDDKIRVNALPFRMYEAIHQCYYRNQKGLQPFLVNGQEVFNRWNTTRSDGADTTPYHLFQHNWELDQYTSGTASPMAGNAPVIGTTVLGDITVEDENGITTYKRETSEDGTISIIRTSPTASVEHDRLAMQIGTGGFTIPDFRAGNAFTRYLEQKLRSGNRYVDYIFGQFSVKPKAFELDMPEYLGGLTMPINSTMVTSTAETGDETHKTLGSFAGQLSSVGSSKHHINHYFDDYGYVMVIMTIIPDPAYSQNLPKHFYNEKPLDYYLPVFGQLSMQPVTYREVCPIQSHNQHLMDNNVKLTDTFCYQRPNWDLIYQPDRVHGQFRTSFKDYVVQRVFDARPEIGNDFLTIKKGDANNIFQYMEADCDICFGLIEFDIKAKRPVARVHVPNLGK